tara:strand:- start:104 stop:1153 length:1050 start_codon:yes stop_codon:yes gene_type:complete
MLKRSFKDSFINFCKTNKFEININQIEIIDILIKFLIPKKKNLFNFFFNQNEKLCFYLHGGVGVGKTMILNFFYDSLEVPKVRLHFNEFMIKFHEYRHKKKDNSISSFVQNLTKNKLIYLDEFQVTNIVDAMILGKLFENIFKENIKIVITSNIKIEDLYKDGLQREQFLPFISIIKKNSIERELIIDDDYRKLSSNKLQRAFSPLNEKTIFKINQLFRELTKNKNLRKIVLNIKGREFIISNYYDGIVKFDFKELCDRNVGAEDYIKIADNSKFIVILNIPNFNETNINQQQRFITLIDILYEKKIFLMISAKSEIEKISSSKKLSDPFKRTLSRLFELTSPKDKFFS